MNAPHTSCQLDISAFADLETPAMVYDERRLQDSLAAAVRPAREAGCRILYSLKACSLISVLNRIADAVDGFACSSVFEARVARSICKPKQTIHFTSPGLRDSDFDELSAACDYLSFNSLTQWQRVRRKENLRLKCGMRLNPQISFVNDARYDPCQPNSKLGVTPHELSRAFATGKLNGVSGLHVHNNCDAVNLSQLLATVTHIESTAGDLLAASRWINLGGGYLFDQATDVQPFLKAVEILKCRNVPDVFVEPGAAIVDNAGCLVATVIDLFDSEGKTVAVLDTTVNHMPEVFEFQYEPDVLDHLDDGKYCYVLAGSTCLAGDIFGEYAFSRPVKVGSPIVFAGCGAYSTVKAHMFNGINLPAVYTLSVDGDLKLEQTFSYEDYAHRNGILLHHDL